MGQFSRGYGSAAKAFQRVDVSKWMGKTGSQNNSYEAAFGDDGWGARVCFWIILLGNCCARTFLEVLKAEKILARTNSSASTSSGPVPGRCRISFCGSPRVSLLHMLSITPRSC